MSTRSLALPVMDFGPWTTTSVAAVADGVAARAGEGRALVLVDGSGGSGKSTFSRRLAAHLPGSAVVGSDDVSWHLHPTNWGREMLDNVVLPWLAGNDVDYRPPGWVAKGREGSVVATGTGVLVVEGVGTARRELAELAAYVVWVSTDPERARLRCIERDLGIDGDTPEEVAAFHASWMELEVPFHLSEKPWERADLIIDGEFAGADEDAVRVVRRSS